MKTERDIAELIFDLFRSRNCRENEIVMLNTLRFSVYYQLNPFEQEMYNIVVNGLLNLGYLKYESHPDTLRLTKKGFLYIYDDELVRQMQNVPWFIPSGSSPCWDDAFVKLWRLLIPIDNLNIAPSQYNSSANVNYMMSDSRLSLSLDSNTFYSWVEAYATKAVINRDSFLEAMGRSVNDAKEMCRQMVDNIEGINKYSFYLCVQNYCEEQVLNREMQHI